MDERAKRIIDTAMELAERDGFAAVRLRDVAAQAQVALGTVYRRFPSKESILVAAAEREIKQGRALVEETGIPGDTPVERLRMLFQLMVFGFCERPNLAKALLRAVGSAEPTITEQVAAFNTDLTAMITAALRGHRSAEVTRREAKIGLILQQVLFAGLVGWAGGLHDMERVVDQLTTAASLLLGEA